MALDCSPEFCLLFLRKFTIIIMGNWPLPLAAMFFNESNSFLLFLLKTVGLTISTKILLNSDQSFQRKRVL